MATVNSSSSTLFSITANASPYGSVTIEVRGSGFTYSGSTLTGGTLESVSLTRYGSTSVMTNFDFSSVAAYGAPGFALPSDTFDSVLAFVTRFGDPDFTIQSGDSLSFFAESDVDVTLRGNDGDNYLTAGDGDDFLFGGAGNDELRGNDGRDVFYGGAGNDNINTDGSFSFGDPDFFSATVFGGSGDDNVYGGNGAETFFGGAGSDDMYAGHGRDLIKGGGGRDYLGGSRGDDIIYGGGKGDVIYGGNTLFYDDEEPHRDNDKLFGGGGADRMSGGVGSDDMFGGRGSDSLDGGRGSDDLFGGKGNDVLSSIYFTAPYDGDDGGSAKARDVLKGGKGMDLFVFTNSQEGRVVIDDFEDGRDLLQLLPDEAFDYYAEDAADSLILAQTQYKAFMDGASQKKGGVLFEGDRGSVMISDMRLRDITVDDFLTYAQVGGDFFS